MGVTIGNRCGFSLIVLTAASFLYSDCGGRGSGGAVSVASTKGETPRTVLFHSKCLRYFLGAQKDDLVLGTCFGAVRLDVRCVFADVASVKSATGPWARSKVVSTADLFATFGSV
jgi:hypothetical protein